MVGIIKRIGRAFFRALDASDPRMRCPGCNRFYGPGCEKDRDGPLAFYTCWSCMTDTTWHMNGRPTAIQVNDWLSRPVGDNFLENLSDDFGTVQ